MSNWYSGLSISFWVVALFALQLVYQQRKLFSFDFFLEFYFSSKEKYKLYCDAAGGNMFICNGNSSHDLKFFFLFYFLIECHNAFTSTSISNLLLNCFCNDFVLNVKYRRRKMCSRFHFLCLFAHGTRITLVYVLANIWFFLENRSFLSQWMESLDRYYSIIDR